MLIKKQIKPVKMNCDIHGKVNFISVINHKENVIGHACEKCSEKPHKRNCKVHGESMFYINKDEVFCCERCDRNKLLICKYHGLTEFSINNKGLTICKKCRAYNTAEFRRKLKKKAVELFGGKCTECGYDKCIAALEFHHVDKTKKEFQVFGMSRNWKRIIEELKKCILLCSNCHREHHWNEGEEQRKNKSSKEPKYLNEWEEQNNEREKNKIERRKTKKYNINIDLIRKLREP